MLTGQGKRFLLASWGSRARAGWLGLNSSGWLEKQAVATWLEQAVLAGRLGREVLAGWEVRILVLEQRNAGLFEQNYFW